MVSEISEWLFGIFVIGITGSKVYTLEDGMVHVQKLEYASNKVEFCISIL
jgi:hypothetical protein